MAPAAPMTPPMVRRSGVTSSRNTPWPRAVIVTISDAEIGVLQRERIVDAVAAGIEDGIRELVRAVDDAARLARPPTKAGGSPVAVGT